MYHYLGDFQLYENSRIIRQFGYRCQSCFDNNTRSDCLIELVDQLELLPGNSAKIQVSFLAINLVAPLINVGDTCKMYEGSRPVGEVYISHDPWAKVEEWIAKGEIRNAVVGSIGWTSAGILMEGDIRTFLTSQDMGLQEWKEIGQVLKSRELVRVRIEKIDKKDRIVEVSFVDRVA